MRKSVILFFSFVALVVVCHPQSKKPLTNDDVVQMVKTGFDEATIVKAIQANEPNFDTSVDALVVLKAAGASDPIIDAMLQTEAKKRQPAAALRAATPSDSTDPNILTNKSVIEMVAAKLPDEVVIAKIQTSQTNFDLSTPALVELNNSGVSANVVKAMMTPKIAPPPLADPPKEPPPPPDPNDPNASHESGIYVYTEKASGKKMILLEPTVYTQGKSGGTFAMAMTYGIAKMKWKAIVRNPRANVRFSDAGAIFYFYFEEKGAGLSHAGSATSTPNEFTLLRLQAKGDTRETVVMKANAFGASSGTEDKANVPFTSTKMSPGVYKVVPNAPLRPGEYAFISAGASGAFIPGAASANRLFDFGVNPPE